MVKLPELQNFSEFFEVALIELIYPNSIRNIPIKINFKIKAKYENQIFTVIKSSFDPGIYNEERLLNKINLHLENLDLEKVKSAIISSISKKFLNLNLKVDNIIKPSIIKNESTNKISVRCGKFSITANNKISEKELFLEFDEYLQKILGFNEQPSCSKVEADNIIDIFGQIHLLYIYCDIVSSIVVGDKKVPLLQVITLNHPSSTEFGSHIRITFDNPMFIPISRKTFDTISIELRDDVGEFIQFETGKTVLTLQFRKAKK